VVGCWLRRHGLASAAEVINTIARSRVKDEERTSRSSPETARQVRFVVGWEG
jgi:hypothetical protein